MDDSRSSFASVLSTLEISGAEIQREGGHYAEFIVELLLKKIEQELPSEIEPDIKSLNDLATHNFLKDSFSYWTSSAHIVGRNKVQRVSAVITEAAKAYSQHLAYLVSCHDEGLPLFHYQAGQLTEANDTNDDYLFVRLILRKGGLYDLRHYSPPSWATTLYVSQRARVVFSWFHYDLSTDSDQYSLAIAARSRAIRAMLSEMAILPHLSDDLRLPIVDSGSGAMLVSSDALEVSRLRGEISKLRQSESTKSTNSMLRVIAGMAMSYACKDGLAQPRSTAQAISADLSKIGIEISDRALSEYLKRGKGLVGGN